jgi:ssDNA-binding Zn-finger/Zn-ribbon topoisomerase 1
MECIVKCTYTPIVLKGFRPLQWLKETVHMGKKKEKMTNIRCKKHGQKTLLRTLRHRQKECYTFSKCSIFFWAIFLAHLPKKSVKL